MTSEYRYHIAEAILLLAMLASYPLAGQDPPLMTRLGPLVAPLNAKIPCGPGRFVTVGVHGLRLEDAQGAPIASDWTVSYRRGPRCPAYYNGYLYLPRSHPKGIRVYDLRNDRFDFVGLLPSRSFGRMAIRDGWLICIDNLKLETYDLREGPLPKQAVVLSPIQQPASYDFENDRFVISVKNELMVYEITEWPRLTLLKTIPEQRAAQPPQAPVVLAGDSLWWGGMNQPALRYDLSDLANVSAEDAGFSLPALAFFREGDRLAFFANRSSVVFEIDRTTDTIRERNQLVLNPRNHGADLPAETTAIVSDDVLIYGGANGVSAYGLGGKSSPNLLGTALGAPIPKAHAVATHAGVLYCDGNIYDFRDPRTPRIHKDLFAKSPTIGIIQNWLVVATGNGLLVYGLDDPLKPQEIQQQPLADTAQAITAHGDNLWVACDSGVVRRYRAGKTLRRSAELLVTREARRLTSLVADDKYLVVAVNGRGVIGHRLNPAGEIMRRAFSFPNPHPTRQLQLHDGLVIMANTIGGLRIVDLFQDIPTQLAGLEAVGDSLNLVLHGDTGYIAEGASGVGIVGFDWEAIAQVAQSRREDAEKLKPFSQWIKQLEARRVSRGEDGQVERLDLSGLEITEEIMKKLALATALHTLKMQKCRLSPSVFAGFSGLVPLRELDLYQARIAGADLAVLAALPYLTNLTLRATDIRDSQLHSLAGAAIEKLSLGNTRITDSGLKMVAQLPALTHLGLNESRITSAGLDALLPLADRLQLLRLSNTDTDDDAAATIGQLKNLTFLELANTRVGDGGLAYLAQLLKLDFLLLRGSLVTSMGVKAIPPMPNLRRLVLGELDSDAVEHLLTQPALRSLDAAGSEIDSALVEKISSSQLTQLTVARDDISPDGVQKLKADGVEVVLLKNEKPRLRQQVDPEPPQGQPLFSGSNGDLEWISFAEGVVRVGYRGDFKTTNLKDTFQQNELEVSTIVVAGSHLWVGSNRGIFEYRPETWSWSRMAINATEITTGVSQMAVADGIVSVTYGAGSTAAFDIAARRWLTNLSPTALESTSVADDPTSKPGLDKHRLILWIIGALGFLGILLLRRAKYDGIR